MGSNWRWYVPWVSWKDLSRREAAGFGYSAHYAYEMLTIEWFGAGVGLIVRPKNKES